MVPFSDINEYSSECCSGYWVELMEFSAFSLKVRVPRLKGGKMGVLATRSPHRPNPIGLSVAKVSPEMVLCFSSVIVAFWNTLRKSILGLRNCELLGRQ